MLTATEVSFASNWLSEMNRHPIAVLQGTTAADADRIAEETRRGLRSTFANTFRHAGYEIVAAPAEGVLALSLRVVDLYINAPVHGHAGASQPCLYARGGAGDASARNSRFHQRDLAGANCRPPHRRSPGRLQNGLQDHKYRHESLRFRRHVRSLGVEQRRPAEGAADGGDGRAGARSTAVTGSLVRRQAIGDRLVVAGPVHAFSPSEK